MLKCLKENWHVGLFLLLVVAFVLLGSFVTEFKLFPKIWATLQTDKWWVDTTISLVLFTVLMSGLVFLVQELRDKIARRPYVNCELEIRGIDDLQPEPIYWMDAKIFRESKFEEWKFIKSSISNFCWIKTSSRKDAYKKWYWIETQSAEKEFPFRYVIDFEKIDPDKDISEWNYHSPPKGFKFVPVVKEENEPRRTIQKISNQLEK